MEQQQEEYKFATFYHASESLLFAFNKLRYQPTPA